MESYKILIVGGGPAGMMAAIRAMALAVPGNVALYEKNASLGRKLGLTGQGRCNISNTRSKEEFLKKFGKNGSFLRSAFNRFFVPELKQFFQDRGLRLKAERQGRIFPETNNSTSVIDVLKDILRQTGVEVHLSSPAKEVLVKENVVKGICLVNGQKVPAEKIIISTGGASYPQTGSTGDGFRIAKDLGHRVAELNPGLIPLEIEEAFVKELQGLTLKNIKVIFFAGSKRLESAIGEILFTHFGVSGPLVLDYSYDVVQLLKKENRVKMAIDFKPGLSWEQLNLKLQHELQRYGPLKLKNYLKKILPQRMVDIFMKASRIEGEKKCHQVTAIDRRKIIESLKRFPLFIKRARPLSEAMVTHGGVSLKEIDPQTMESRKIKGLYFCGEVLDVAAPSGGFNLQAAFSTGYLAGEAAALSLRSENRNVL